MSEADERDERMVVPLRGLRVGNGHDELLTSRQAAAILGVSTERVMQFIRDGRLEARKEGRDWFISKRGVVRLARTKRPPGRPVGWRRYARSASPSPVSPPSRSRVARRE